MPTIFHINPSTFKDGLHRQNPAVLSLRSYEHLEPLHTRIDRCYRLIKENRYYMEHNNTYIGHDNVFIHVIEHDIVTTIDILNEHSKTYKWSYVLDI